MVHYLRKHLLNRTINSCTAYDDPIVYGKVGTSASAFQDAITGRRVTGAAQQGKYFYMTFDKPPHAVMHLGMTGWIKFSSEYTGYYRSSKEEKEGQSVIDARYCVPIVDVYESGHHGREKLDVKPFITPLQEKVSIDEHRPTTSG